MAAPKGKGATMIQRRVKVKIKTDIKLNHKRCLTRTDNTALYFILEWLNTRFS